MEDDPNQPCCAISGEAFERVYRADVDRWFILDAVVLSGPQAAGLGLRESSIVKAACLANAAPSAHAALPAAAAATPHAARRQVDDQQQLHPDGGGGITVAMPAAKALAPPPLLGGPERKRRTPEVLVLQLPGASSRRLASSRPWRREEDSQREHTRGNDNGSAPSHAEKRARLH